MLLMYVVNYFMLSVNNALARRKSEKLIRSVFRKYFLLKYRS